MPSISANAAPEKDHASQYTPLTMGGSWADVFHYNNKNYLCIVDYNSKFPIVKRLEGMSAENHNNAVKIIFTEYGIPQKIKSDAGTNFVSNRF